jgi:hypothetical protein
MPSLKYLIPVSGKMPLLCAIPSIDKKKMQINDANKRLNIGAMIFYKDRISIRIIMNKEQGMLNYDRS